MRNSVTLCMRSFRFDTGTGSLRWLAAQLMEQAEPFGEEALRERADEECRRICHAMVLNDVSLQAALLERGTIASDLESFIPDLEKAIKRVIHDVQRTDEVGALLNGFNGGYIEPGPSGLITRGRSDILPTGRNFFSLDPQRIPTPSAWEIGKLLGKKTLEKYLIDEDRYPESIAFYWQCTDIMWADGEGMAQMMYSARGAAGLAKKRSSQGVRRYSS